MSSFRRRLMMAMINATRYVASWFNSNGWFHSEPW